MQMAKMFPLLFVLLPCLPAYCPDGRWDNM